MHHTSVQVQLSVIAVRLKQTKNDEELTIHYHGYVAQSVYSSTGAQMTGATKEGIALGDKMSSALLNFARTGNPNAKGLPKWPAFTPETEATMYFDAPKCRITYKK